MQEGYEAGTNENGEITQVAIQAYEGAEGFSVLEQATEEIHSTGPGYRYNQSHQSGTTPWCNGRKKNPLLSLDKFRKYSLVFTVFLCVVLCFQQWRGESPAHGRRGGRNRNSQREWRKVLPDLRARGRGVAAGRGKPEGNHLSIHLSGYIYPVLSLSFIPNHVVRIVAFRFCSVQQKIAERSSVDIFSTVVLDDFAVPD